MVPQGAIVREVHFIFSWRLSRCEASWPLSRWRALTSQLPTTAILSWPRWTQQQQLLVLYSNSFLCFKGIRWLIYCQFECSNM